MGAVAMGEIQCLSKWKGPVVAHSHCMGPQTHPSLRKIGRCGAGAVRATFAAGLKKPAASTG